MSGPGMFGAPQVQNTITRLERVSCLGQSYHKIRTLASQNFSGTGETPFLPVGEMTNGSED